MDTTKMTRYWLNKILITWTFEVKMMKRNQKRWTERHKKAQFRACSTRVLRRRNSRASLGNWVTQARCKRFRWRMEEQKLQHKLKERMKALATMACLRTIRQSLGPRLIVLYQKEWAMLQDLSKAREMTTIWVSLRRITKSPNREKKKNLWISAPKRKKNRYSSKTLKLRHRKSWSI